MKPEENMMTTQTKTSAPVAAAPIAVSVNEISDHQGERGSMPVQRANLFLPEDLEDLARTGNLGESDLKALHAVVDWIKSFVAKPHKELGRSGPVCPFVPRALDLQTIWLAPERTADRSVLDIVQRMNSYRRLFLDVRPDAGDDADYKSFVVVFTDLSADRAKNLFADILQHLGVPSYADDGLVMGGFYQTSEGSALYNPNFRPFKSPVPFLLMRHTVISDWKFFLDNEDWLNLWAHRYGESAVPALAAELRRLPWRARRD